MTVEKPAIESETELNDEDKQAQEEATAESEFNAAFDDVSSNNSTALGDKPKPDEENADKAPLKTEEDENTAESKPDTGIAPQQDKVLSRRLRKLEGNFGSLNAQLTQINEKFDGLSKPDNQSQEDGNAEKSDELKELLSEFKEMTPLVKQIEDMQEELKELRASGANQSEIQSAELDIDEVTEQAALKVKHPTWKKDVATDEFQDFMISGGPSKEDLKNYNSSLEDDEALKEIEADWAEDHPKWWDKTGQYAFGRRPGDLIATMDLYTESKSESERIRKQQETAKIRKTKRLRSSVSPEGGTGQGSATGTSDEEAFSSGFNSVASKRL